MQKHIPLSIKDERNENIMRVYRRVLAQAEYPLDMDAVYKAVSEAPADRFYVTAERAMNVLSRIDEGDPLSSMVEGRRQMYLEIHRRVAHLQGRHREWPRLKAVITAITSPAPRFYLEASSLKIIIWRIKKFKKENEARNKTGLNGRVCGYGRA